MKRTCPACGQEVEVKIEDITDKCTLEWYRGESGMAMIVIRDGSKTVALIGLDGYNTIYTKEYELEKVCESADCGWWFRVMRVL